MTDRTKKLRILKRYPAARLTPTCCDKPSGDGSCSFTLATIQKGQSARLKKRIINVTLLEN